MTTRAFVIRRMRDLGFTEIVRDETRIVLRNVEKDVTISVRWEEMSDATLRDARKLLHFTGEKKRSRAAIAKRKAQADRAARQASHERERMRVRANDVLNAERMRLVAEDRNSRFWDRLMRSTPGS